MNLLLLNRDFTMPADNWYHVVPRGVFPHPTGVDQVIDSTAAAAMVEDFRNRSKVANFPGLLVDFDHFSDDTDAPSEAAGWISDLANRDTGVWARIRWSDLGEAAVKGGRYRLASPVFSGAGADVDKLDNKRRVRVKRLLKVALTNDPNLRGMVPLSNRVEPGGPPDSNHKQKGKMKTIASKLGLSAEASEDAILEAVVKLQNRATDAETAIEPLKTENQKLKDQNLELVETQVETDLEKYSNRFKPEAADKWKAALLKNRDETIELLESMPEATGSTASTGANGKLLNRRDAKTPGASDATADDGRAKSDKILNRARELQKSGGITFDQAWTEATRETARS